LWQVYKHTYCIFVINKETNSDCNMLFISYEILFVGKTRGFSTKKCNFVTTRKFVCMIENDKNRTIICNSLKGIARLQNQDDIWFMHTDTYSLFILFDGVSSLKKSIDYIQYCKYYLNKNYNLYINSEVKLDRLIYDMHLSSLSSSIYGKTTCSALLLHFNLHKAFIVNVGDSRIYSFSNYFLEPLTVDDNLSGNSRILTKYIGLEELMLDDITQKEIDITQNFLICSDGFHNLMEEDIKKYFMIFQYKRNKNIVNAINRLQTNKNRDDSTYIIIRRNGL